MQFLLVAMLLLFITGLFFAAYAFKRYGNCSVTDKLSWWGRSCIPIWKQQDHFTSRKGYIFYVLGSFFVGLGASIGVVFYFVLK